MDTIFATSSGRPPAAIAVLRVSGPDAASVALRLAGGVPTPRRVSLRTLRDANGALLDRALVLWFPKPGSATGEDLLELHVHGGRAVIAAVEAALSALPGLRRAAPGEFTRRALLAGRIDLAQAAGLADLLAAETETQRRAAIASAEGSLSRDIRAWMDRLSSARAMVEAMIDYDDEDDVVVSLEDVRAALLALTGDLHRVIAQPTVERLNAGFRIVVAGPPNAGKSSLFNALVEREAAIVTPIAGTTRDRLEASVIRSGHIFSFVDTAGLAERTDDPVEMEGIGRSHIAMAAADLILWLGDELPPAPGKSLWLQSRCDQPGREHVMPGQTMAVSANLSETVAALWGEITVRASTAIGAVDDYALHDTQRTVIADVAARCGEALTEDDVLLLAEQLRVAARGVGGLLGIDASEAMLDTLFAKFCVGK